ncbi:YSC84-related protein [Alteromonas sp. 1_MG-2023]|uniref:lipid-binding SYLF domain-containing protein n=1 Tax=Alteromonas sp. 1_MG-2023 TaxID=3062669 RepID=UPI0026E377D2|nr:YSC84-related protein [Alteromonas sp. 1_MG-2023]MDO6568676.1 YSC84-related protein [Alteromonas sp. 1_MG-2023]
MNFKNLASFSLLGLVLLAVTGCASMGDGSVAEKRQAILDMQQNALAKLYIEKPDTRSQIRDAAGYAVFTNANINVIFFAAGTGYGVVNNQVTGTKTYMNMAEGGVGLGLGAKDYRVVMVFHSQKAMNYFIENGWTVGGNADAAAKAGSKGMSAEGEGYLGNVTVYTMTETGLALQATVKGTKFWVDKELN